jgi:hypothetical protein
MIFITSSPNSHTEKRVDDQDLTTPVDRTFQALQTGILFFSLSYWPKKFYTETPLEIVKI